MAKAQVVQNDVVIELTLSMTEALYVYGALNRVTPVDGTFEDDSDPVYDALQEAIFAAGREPIDGLELIARVRA